MAFEDDNDSLFDGNELADDNEFFSSLVASWRAETASPTPMPLPAHQVALPFPAMPASYPGLIQTHPDTHSADPVSGPSSGAAGHTSASRTVSDFHISDEIDSVPSQAHGDEDLLLEQELLWMLENDGLAATEDTIDTTTVATRSAPMNTPPAGPFDRVLQAEEHIQDPLHADPQPAPEFDDSSIFLRDVKGLKWGDASTRKDLKVPRRVDQNAQARTIVMEYIALPRSIKYEELYLDLELRASDGIELRKALTERFKQPPQIAALVAQNGAKKDAITTKTSLSAYAYQLLVVEGWGPSWFGHDSKSASARELFWPEESTRLFVHFMRLLYRIRENVVSKLRERNKKQKQFAQASTWNHQSVQTPSSESSRSQPDDSEGAEAPQFDSINHNEPHDAAHSPFAGLGSPTSTPTHSGFPAPEISSPSTSASLTIMQSSPSPSLSTRRHSILSPLIQQACENKKRKRDRSAFGSGEAEEPEVEVPADANIVYILFVSDVIDGHILSEPTNLRHRDHIVSAGTFLNLRAHFEAAGHRPQIELQVGGVWQIISEVEQWDAAVLEHYKARRHIIPVNVYI